MHNQFAILALAAVLIIPISSNALAQDNITAADNNQTGNVTAAAPPLAAGNDVTTTEPIEPGNVTAGNVTETPALPTSDNQTSDNVTATTPPPEPLPEPESPAMVECTQAYPGNPEICEGAYGAEPDCIKLNSEGQVYNIQVNPPDPFRLDNDADGLGCEISQLQGQPPSEPQTNETS